LQHLTLDDRTIGFLAQYGCRKEIVGTKHRGNAKLYKLVPAPEEAAVVLFTLADSIRQLPSA
jgi:hypothetical protein